MFITLVLVQNFQVRMVRMMDGVRLLLLVGVGLATAQYGAQPYGPAPYGPAPYGPAPYAPVPYGPVPYGPAPYEAVPYGPALPNYGSPIMPGKHHFYYSV
jgi:hypothetical protein